MLQLATKPDMAEVALRWRHFWNRELYRRPPVLMTVPRAGADRTAPVEINRLRYYQAVNGLWEERLAAIDRWLDLVVFPGDGVPMVTPDFGPDQWAAYFGAELRFSEGAMHTSWVTPVIDDWESFLPLELDPANPTFRKQLDYARTLAGHGEGRYLVGYIDAHSNADALSALRGPERFLTDLYDRPGQVEQAMAGMRRSYRPVHEAFAAAGRMGGGRGYGHGLWNEKTFQIVQSDVICMLGPEHFRRLVLPALEEEFACHESAYFHLDGPGALHHLDDILAIPGYWILQWQPGDGQKPNWQWPDILKRAQAAGKGVLVFGAGLDLDAIRKLNAELDPARVVYMPDVRDEEEARRLLERLERGI